MKYGEPAAQRCTVEAGKGRAEREGIVGKGTEGKTETTERGWRVLHQHPQRVSKG